MHHILVICYFYLFSCNEINSGTCSTINKDLQIELENLENDISLLKSRKLVPKFEIDNTILNVIHTNCSLRNTQAMKTVEKDLLATLTFIHVSKII
jgi:hypothetical protein